MAKNGNKETVGMIIQLTGMIAIIAGIITEIAYAAHIGFICITAGSLAWGIGTKVRGK